MTGLDEGYKLTVKTVTNFHTEVEDNISQIEKGLSKLDLKESSEESKYETERQKILKRERENEVEKHTQNLLTELDQRRDFLKKSVQDEKNRSEKIKKDLENRRESLGYTPRQNNANEVFDIFKQERALRADRKQKVEPVNTKFKGLPQYVPGSQPILKTQHGELIEFKDENKQDKFRFKVLQQFKTKLPIVESVVCCEDGTLWISYCFTYTLQKIQLNKGSVPVQVLKKLKVNSLDMALLPTGDLLISSMEPVLQILSNATGEIKQATYSFTPLQTTAVHVTKANQIIVGVREKGEPFPVKGPRQVIVMDMDGRKEKVYHLDNDRQSIFTVPIRIISDNDNNIFVLDRLKADVSGRIVALNKTNGIRWVYSGQLDIKKQKKFQPGDLVVTKSDNIIITDRDNHLIHILNTSGQCIHYLNTKDQLGFELPFSLDIDNKGSLYIGCSTYSSEPEAKLYTVQVSGF
ncbi:unnamed protein product [Mytilus coruscus]|uniref:TRIM2_3 n=1 Tax=Mytilus coruscus TaxID=42192 RepID=A0A6J8B600_MYTCO|nr:unnamed protein product [Mytilus coruscus]